MTTERLRWLASDENPDAWTRAGYRALLARGGEPEPDPPPQPPQPITQSVPQPTLGRAPLIPIPLGGCCH